MNDSALKKCSNCKLEKLLLDFTKGKGACKICCSEKTKEYNRLHKEARKEYNRIYNLNNKLKIKERDAARSLNNKDHIKNIHKIWSLDNKTHLAKYQKDFKENNKEYFTIYNREYSKSRKEKDPIFRLRKSFSSFIATSLKNRGGSKNKKSCFDNLPYSFDELKEHLEKQFEPWMTWNNRGNYNSKTWNDNDNSTWTWQLDHIIPQADIPYSSMEDDAFKKAWALSNLRPLSAKINILEGASRIRHLKRS
jgi:hypothetical protein